MKKLFILASLILPVSLMAQELTEAQKAALNAAQAINNTEIPVPPAPKPNYWKNSIQFDLGLNQTWMSNWAAGGYASVTLAAGIDGKANYEKGRALWNNRMQLNYGALWSADKIDLIQSNNDRIYLESKFAYRMSDESKWSYSAGLDFRTQFGASRDNFRKNDEGKWIGDLKSTILSPAYFNVALGIDWKPNNWFDMSIAPVTGGVIAVLKDELRESYGMQEILNNGDPTGTFKNSKWQLGAQVKANIKVNVNDWFNYETQLVAFVNYLGKKTEKVLTINDNEVKGTLNDIYRINWDNKISFNVAKYFKIALQTWLVYDPSIFYNKNNKDNAYEKTIFGPVQFKEFFSVNFTYTIASKK